MKSKLFTFIGLLVLLAFSLNVTGQVRLEESRSSFVKKTRLAPNHTQSNSVDSVINLPIFDDFSTYLGEPDTNIWLTDGGATVMLGIAYHPPTLGVAMFDGIRDDGRPYDFNSNFPKGDADVLESKLMDLSPYNPADSLYLSFFWQQGGRGDAPEFSHLDSLTVDFWSPGDTAWKQVWGRVALEYDSTLVADSAVVLNDTFFTAMIPVLDTSFFKPDFKFRIKTRGTLSGSFDVWNIDYVFFDKDRFKGDFFFLDRALTETQGTVFRGFSGIPIDHARKLGTDTLFAGGNSTQIRTLSNTFSSYVFSVVMEEELSNHFYYRIDEDGGIIDGYFKTQTLRDTTDFSSLGVLRSDSQIISKTFFLRGTGDSTRRGYDAKVNDTLSVFGYLMDFYSYDDGHSEGAIGIRTPFGKVAYQFPLYEQDTLTALDIQFLPSDVNLAGASIGLRIWSRLDELYDEEIYAMDTDLRFPEEGETFYRYELDSAVIVSDTIYIGWIQFDNQLVNVGYDMNNVFNDRIYSKTNASGWRWESDFFPGSMLFRPVMGEVTQPLAKEKREPNQKAAAQSPYDVKIGPNPSNGIINIYGDYDKIRIVDHQGKIVWHEDFNPVRTQLDLSRLEDGFYLIYFEKDLEFVTRRIYLKK